MEPRRNGPLALLFHATVVLFMLAPLIIVCLVAFTPGQTLSIPWGDYSLRWFRAVFEHSDLVQSFWNSLGVAAVAATVSVALAVPAGLAIARFEFRGRQALNGLLLSPLIVPHLVLGVAMLLNGGAKVAFELARCPQKPRHDEVKQAPQLAQMVLKRRA